MDLQNLSLLCFFSTLGIVTLGHRIVQCFSGAIRTNVAATKAAGGSSLAKLALATFGFGLFVRS